MEIKQLRYFLQVVNDGSMLKAAKNLIVSQQAVSKAIQNLESELGGLPLFVRSSAGVTPTEHGKLLAAEAEQILSRVDAVSEQFEGDSRALRGRVSIGFLHGHLGAQDYLPIDPLIAFRGKYPLIDLNWCNASSSMCSRGVQSGEMDFAFSVLPEPQEAFNCTKIYDFGWYAAVCSANPLAERPFITPADLAGQSIIFPKEEPWLCGAESFPAGRQPKLILTDELPYDIVQQLVISHNGLMFYAAPHVALLNPTVLKPVPFECDRMRSVLFLIEKQGKGFSPAAALARRTLLDAWTHRPKAARS